ncbi:MAG: 1-aminocyclopropane-1-carboxylate deaminase/D-cysteine desulfhydrase [Candidatus Xenobia bacterium]
MITLLPPRLALANLPTPVERLRLDETNGIELWIKRDDLTGSALSGNKVRKLEYLLHEACGRGADHLITCGGIQSNHCRATALAAAMSGMQCTLFLRGAEPDVSDGNLLLDRLAGARVIWITREQYSKERNKLMAAETERLRQEEGRTPYVIPEGGSNALGAWGYVQAVDEIQKQMPAPDYIVCATGSGGTQAGLILGCRHYLPRTQVVGVNVCDDEAYFRNVIGGVLEDWQHRWGSIGLTSEDVVLADGYVGQGYALNTPDELATLRDLVRRTGIVLDPVYTLKGFIGLISELGKGRFRSGSRVLFIHTGGIFGLFPKRAEFSL